MNTTEHKFSSISRAVIGLGLLVLLSACGKKITLQEDWAAYQVTQAELKQTLTTQMMALGPRASKRDATAAEFEALAKDLDAAQKEMTDKINAIKPQTKAVQNYHAAFSAFQISALSFNKQIAQYNQDKNKETYKKALDERLVIQETLNVAEKAMMSELEKAQK